MVYLCDRGIKTKVDLYKLVWKGCQAIRNKKGKMPNTVYSTNTFVF